MITKIKLDLYDMPFCKLRMESMHPFKSYLGETILYFTPTTKTKSKKGHNRQNFADDYQYRTWPGFYNDISFCKL